MNKKSTGSIVIIVILSVILAINCCVAISGFLKGYKGVRTATETDLYGLTRGRFEEIANVNSRTLYSNGKVSPSVAAGLAVGEYYHDAIIANALDKAGDEKAEFYYKKMNAAKTAAGDYSYAIEQIDEFIEDAIFRASERAGE